MRVVFAVLAAAAAVLVHVVAEVGPLVGCGMWLAFVFGASLMSFLLDPEKRQPGKRRLKHALGACVICFGGMKAGCDEGEGERVYESMRCIMCTYTTHLMCEIKRARTLEPVFVRPHCPMCGGVKTVRIMQFTKSFKNSATQTDM